MMGSLLKKGDVGILFSSAGNGKSILGIQCADNLSKGQSAFGGILRNECGPQVVAYFDMELSLSDYQNRYMDAAGNPYPFAGENQFVRVGNDDEQSKTFAEIARNIERILIQNIERIRPNVVIIDNITAISNGSTADAVVAAKIMDLLMLLKKHFKLTILILAHTPKRYDLSKPLVLEDLAGSSLFLAYADTIIAIGSSKMGSNIKYLKHIKVRSSVKIYDENNVIQVAIVKEGAFLHMKTLEEPFGRESDHLINKNEVAVNDELIRKMVELHTEGKSLQEIKTDLKIDISRQHIGRILKTQQEKRSVINNDFDEALKAENPF
jgi:archaellum biogenesis ATPase FlaH